MALSDPTLGSVMPVLLRWPDARCRFTEASVTGVAVAVIEVGDRSGGGVVVEGGGLELEWWVE